MNQVRSIAGTAVLIALLSACDGLHAPSPEEAGGRKLSQAAARASALSSRIAPARDVIGKAVEEEGGPRELTQAMLAPDEGAEQLGTLASEVSGAGSGEAQRREARDLAARMRTGALALRMMELERIAQAKGALAREIQHRVAMISTIEASGDMSGSQLAQARIASMQRARNAFDEAISALRAMGKQADEGLRPLEGSVADLNRRADEIEARIAALRAEAMVARPEAAMHRMLEAEQRLDEAQDLRIDAARADREAEPLRGVLRIVGAAVSGNEETDRFLSRQVEEASDAAEGASARAAATRDRLSALSAETAALARDFLSVDSGAFQPAARAVAEAIESGDLATKAGTDAAALAIARARLAAIMIAGIDDASLVAAVGQSDEGGAPTAPEEGLAAARMAEVARAKTALLAARDALAGLEAGPATSMLSSIDRLARALGIDLDTAAAQESPAAEPPAAEPPAAEPPAAQDMPPSDVPAPEPRSEAEPKGPGD